MACDTTFEGELFGAGHRLIAGADEVGRGALAGPVVAAAVILNPFRVPEGINDSKKLTKLQRQRLEVEIKETAIAYSIARIEHHEIDQINIHHASLLAIGQAVKALQPIPDYVLIDGKFKVPQLSCPQMPIIKGDSLSVSVGAASILAKVARDRLMKEYDEQFPGYGFASHVGYNTRVHQEAIVRLGPSDIHRLTFHGVQSFQAALDLREEEPPLSSLQAVK
ncbi:MAG: ribonuclease HII [Blastocatellia bacterium]